MIKMSIGLTRISSLSREEFRDYWLNRHAPLVRSVSDVLGIRRYTQIYPELAESGLPGAENVVFDGVAEIWFDDIETVTVRHMEPAAKRAARKLRDDEAKFIDRNRSCLWWGTEITII